MTCMNDKLSQHGKDHCLLTQSPAILTPPSKLERVLINWKKMFRLELRAILLVITGAVH